MAALKPCKTCEHQVSVSAKTCPSCGEINPTTSAKDTVIGMVVLIAIIGGVIAWSSIGDSSTNNSETSTAAMTDLDKVDFSGLNQIVDASVGCADRDTYDTLANYVNEGDNEAFKKALYEQVIEGNCTLFKKGQQVYAEDSSWSGIIKVRLKGETSSFWINSKNVEKLPDVAKKQSSN